MPQHGSGRWLVGIGAAVVALALVSVLVSVLAGGRAPASLEPGSPEEAVQRYLLAIKDRDHASAYALLSPDIREVCSYTDYVAESRYFYQETSDFRVQLDEAVILDADTADVRVRITQFYGNPPFDLSESNFTASYLMTRVDGDWYLDQAAWPYWGCAYRIEKPDPTPTPTPTPTPEPAA
jgi:hypothetical protein